MPTITSTPVQVASDPQYRMTSEEIGPFVFEIGSYIYQVLVASQDLIPTEEIAVFRRLTSSTGGAWAQVDAANQPNHENQEGSVQACYNATTNKLAVLYVSGASRTGFKICELDVSLGSPTWGSPTTEFTASLGAYDFTFNAMASGAYRIVYLDAGNLSYVDNTAGTWGSGNILAGGGIIPLGGPIDSSDNTYIITSEGSFLLNLRILTVGGSLGGAILIHNNVHSASSGRGPNSVLWVSGDAIAVGYFPSGGTFGGDAVISIGTPLSAPVFTAYDVFAVGATDDVTYINPAVSRDGLTLNGFFVHTDVTTTPKIDEIRQSVFDGASTWAASTLYYDEITNPPPNGSTGVNQFIHAMQQIELPQGWSSAATMETDNGSPPPVRWCTGFFMEPMSGTPTRTLYTWPPILLGSPTPPPGTFNANCPSPIYVVGTPYDSFVTVTGGTGPYTFAVTSGSLPTGLSLNASTGEITGTPSATGPFSFTITVTDHTGATASTGSCSAGRCPGTKSII